MRPPSAAATPDTAVLAQAATTSDGWDVAVIGTGMGGATVGGELARLGRKVLFIEKGLLLQSPRCSGHDSPPSADDPREDPASRLTAGRWPVRLRGRIDAREVEFFAPLGSGTGGTTVLYGAALERMTPEDFQPRANFPGATDTVLPSAWPISYEELVPFYREAEALFRVRGTVCSLASDKHPILLEPPPLCPRDESLFALFQTKGFHPYRLHVACEYVKGCEECGSKRCVRDCKNDAARICLNPAVLNHGATLITGCEVLRLEATGTTVERIWCRQGKREFAVEAKTVVLAAGAYATPAILLRSASDVWPNGLANESGHVGRNLMFHLCDFFAIRPSTRRLVRHMPGKTLAFNDLYSYQGVKLGTFQSLGTNITVGQVMLFIRELAETRARWWAKIASPTPAWWRKLSSPILRLCVLGLRELFDLESAAIFASIIEDLPYGDNRIVLDKATGRARIEYRLREEARIRAKVFRTQLVARIGRFQAIPLGRKAIINFGHVCGTCRFGDDPRSSVLDRNNRAHGLANLYITDASFFPSSAGTNPSLTIAANALRVAGVIHRTMNGAL